MTIRNFFVISLLALFPCVTNAQMLDAPAAVRAPQQTLSAPTVVKAEPQKEVPQITAEDILNQVQAETETSDHIATISDAELAEIQQPVKDDLSDMVHRASPAERRALVKIMQNLQKTATRRKNLTLPQDQQLDVNDDVDVNPSSAQDVEKYFIEKLLTPINNDIITKEKAI